MAQKFYLDQDGNQFSLDGRAPDPSWTEVPSPRPDTGMVLSNGSWVYTPQRLREYAADVRWKRETGGMSINGMPIKTDRESQSLLTGAHVRAQLTQQNVRWKTDAGFIELTPDQIRDIALAVGSRVQACFDAESAIVLLIDGGTITTVQQIETWEGWPS